MKTPNPTTGKILDVNLCEGLTEQTPTERYSEGVLGGIGVAVQALLERVDAGVRPLDPENMITFNAGVLVGTSSPSACRTTIASMNVLTGGYGSASAAGYFAPELKYAGFDSIFVSGKASRPVFLFVSDGKAEILDASHLWGKTTWDTEDLIRQQFGDQSIQVLSIGPAGENLVSAANVMVCRNRSASRCGLGAIMGSKNLKAIAVRGSGIIQVAQPESFVRCCGRHSGHLASTNTATMLRRYGTPASFPQWNEIGNLPGKNFQTNRLTEKGALSFTPELLEEKVIQKNFGCFSCSIHCTQLNSIKSGKFKGTSGEKLECQAFWDFGAKLGVETIEAVVKGSTLCAELGLDMNNATGAISFAMECYQRGLITERDTNGLKLEWGDEEVIVELLHQIAHVRGIGSLLKDGAVAAAKTIGNDSEKFAMHVKGQDLAEEFRGLVGWALGIMVSERGGAHTTGAPLAERYSVSPERSQELFGISTASDPMAYEGKAELVVYYQRFHSALEALGTCFFSSNWIGAEMLGPEDYVTLYNLAMGSNISVDDLMMAGERIHTLQKLFNIKHRGFSREEDVPQDRMFEVPPNQTNTKIGLDRGKWSKLLDDYYALHDWDVKTGYPRPECLSRLGLEVHQGILD